MRVRALAFIVGLAAVVPLTIAPPAGADPISAPSASRSTYVCEKLGTLEVVGNGTGWWERSAEPQLVLNSHQVLVAYRFYVVFTPTGGDPVVVLDTGKPAPRNGRLDVCHATVSDPLIGTADGTFWVTYRPN